MGGREWWEGGYGGREGEAVPKRGVPVRRQYSRSRGCVLSPCLAHVVPALTATRELLSPREGRLSLLFHYYLNLLPVCPLNARRQECSGGSKAGHSQGLPQSQARGGGDWQ